LAVGVAFCILIGVPFVVILFLAHTGPALSLIISLLLFSLVEGLLLYFVLAGRNMTYALGQQELETGFRFSTMRIPYSFIKSVQVAYLTLTLRLFGGSLPGLHWGLFRTKEAGQVHVYSTKARGEFVLIELFDGRKIAVAPPEPTEFAQLLEARRSNTTAASAEQVKRLGYTGKRVVYAQVAVVTAAYLLFLTYFASVYPSLPEIIPVHFNLHWSPDRWAHKSELFLFAGVAGVFPVLNSLFMLKFGTYSKGFTVFLGFGFTFAIAMFAAILRYIVSIP